MINKRIIEIVYLYYMFRIFETRICFNHPGEYFILNYLNDNFSDKINKYIQHPISKSKFKESKICPLGKSLILVLIGYLIFEEITKIKIYNKYVLIITFILSLMNLNATIYLIPFFILELYSI